MQPSKISQYLGTGMCAIRGCCPMPEAVCCADKLHWYGCAVKAEKLCNALVSLLLPANYKNK